ncbi:helix-turn-helix transcriptional regulator [Streptomyces sp. NPDC049906]|uniref:helix-turn-helix domain-containing protein n=1 Tax=Streptomyces sp. NPDC049906 TaxID=3155656 RepID=UPI00341A1924
MTPDTWQSSGTLIGGQRSPGRAREGSVTGHLFKITRERAGLTQQGLAEALGVDHTTVQGWESGRRPLASVSTANFRSVQRTLLRYGADPALLALFDVAMDADAVLGRTLHGGASTDCATHPLATLVFSRTSTHMIAWALTGTPPAALPAPTADTPQRRGPTPDGPLLGAAERSAFFDRLRRYAEVAHRAGENGALLRRQALYLCGYDTAPDTRAWIADVRSRQARVAHRTSWSRADARSLATSLTRYGDREPLQRFVERELADDAGEQANLNYWAYWFGLDRLPRGDDSFMGSCMAWDGGALLRRLVDRLAPDLGCIDLNVHSVWALLAARPGLLSVDPALRRDLAGRVAGLLDGGTVSARSRRELDALHYGLKMNS